MYPGSDEEQPLVVEEVQIDPVMDRPGSESPVDTFGSETQPVSRILHMPDDIQPSHGGLDTDRVPFGEDRVFEEVGVRKQTLLEWGSPDKVGPAFFQPTNDPSSARHFKRLSDSGFRGHNIAGLRPTTPIVRDNKNDINSPEGSNSSDQRVDNPKAPNRGQIREKTKEILDGTSRYRRATNTPIDSMRDWRSTLGSQRLVRRSHNSASDSSIKSKSFATPGSPVLVDAAIQVEGGPVLMQGLFPSNGPQPPVLQDAPGKSPTSGSQPPQNNAADAPDGK